ncbi:MAG: FMN-binding protein, partial [Eubacteriales bacterium]|nr:FMN-binding protein [Eubacteriales bacterium]
ETPGLGAVAAASTDAGVAFREQFVGTTGNLTVNKDGGTIDAITGSTVTSRAVTNGVNSAVEAAALLID